jgi:hypothetical protein
MFHRFSLKASVNDAAANTVRFCPPAGPVPALMSSRLPPGIDGGAAFAGRRQQSYDQQDR